MRRSSARSQSGLGLLEIMISTVIVVVVLIGTVAAILSGAQLSRETARMHAATRAMNTVMEEVRSVDATELISVYHGRRVKFSDVGISQVDGTVDISVKELGSVSDDSVLFEVEIGLTYDGATRDEHRTIVTQITTRVEGTALAGPLAHAALDKTSLATDELTPATDPNGRNVVKDSPEGDGTTSPLGSVYPADTTVESINTLKFLQDASADSSVRQDVLK